MKKYFIIFLVLASLFMVGYYFQVPSGGTYFQFKKLAVNPTTATPTNKGDLFFKYSGTAGDTGLYRRFADGSIKRIDSAAGSAFIWSVDGGATVGDSLRFNNNAYATWTRTGNAVTVRIDSAINAHKADTLVNNLQYVWKRTSTGMADLVNPADTVFVGKNTGYNAFLATGKLNFNQVNNGGTYSIVFGGDSATLLDAGYMIGRMNTNQRWLVRHLATGNALQTAVMNSNGSIPMYYAMSPSGIGVAILPTNTFDVAGNVGIGGGTMPTMSGQGNLYVHATLSAGFANVAAVNAGENILLGIDSDADGIYIGGEYPKDGDNARNMYRQEGVTTTFDTLTTRDTIFQMNAAGDSTCAIMIEVNVVAYRSGGGTPANRGQASYKLIGTFGYENGTVIQLGTTTVAHSAESDAALSCVLSASGNNIILTYNGIGGEFWRWYVYSNRYYAGHISQ